MLFNGKIKMESITIGKVKCASLWLAVNKKAVKIWETISSCFGTGVWKPDRPWKGNDTWKHI